MSRHTPQEHDDTDDLRAKSDKNANLAKRRLVALRGTIDDDEIDDLEDEEHDRFERFRPKRR